MFITHYKYTIRLRQLSVQLNTRYHSDAPLYKQNLFYWWSFCAYFWVLRRSFSSIFSKVAVCTFNLSTKPINTSLIIAATWREYRPLFRQSVSYAGKLINAQEKQKNNRNLITGIQTCSVVYLPVRQGAISCNEIWYLDIMFSCNYSRLLISSLHRHFQSKVFAPNLNQTR